MSSYLERYECQLLHGDNGDALLSRERLGEGEDKGDVVKGLLHASEAVADQVKRCPRGQCSLLILTWLLGVNDWRAVAPIPEFCPLVREE